MIPQSLANIKPLNCKTKEWVSTVELQPGDGAYFATAQGEAVANAYFTVRTHTQRGRKGTETHSKRDHANDEIVDHVGRVRGVSV
jgi:hypothetical protein